MHDPQIYRGMTDQQISEKVIKLGFNPIKISNPPGFQYSPHSHRETKLLAFLAGSMTVRVADDAYECQVGDRLIIPGNVIHSVFTGSTGCTFFWSEKVI